MKQLGFGCVRLTYHLTYKKAIENLETAFDAGITHFDVARLYGFGTAEKILGQFIKGKRDQVTVTSKFGYYPGNPLMGNLYIQNFSRSVFRMLKKMPTRKAAQGAANEIVLHKNFTVADAEKSLETSLKALQTDHIDYYLLHEPTVTEANNPEIIAFLEKQKQKGTIREHGLGSFVKKIEQDINRLPSGYSVLQSDCSFPFDFPLPHASTSSKRLFFFSPFRYYGDVQKLLKHDKALAVSLSDILSFDVAGNLADLFLLHQVYSPHHNTTLFTSSHNHTIRKTADRWKTLQSSSTIDAERWNMAKRILQTRLQSTISEE